MLRHATLLRLLWAAPCSLLGLGFALPVLVLSWLLNGVPPPPFKLW